MYKIKFQTLSVNHILLGILFFTFCIRILIFNQSLNYQNHYLTGDTQSYHDTALSWINTGSFSLSLDYIDIPETVRTPGYPCFLGIIYKVFGEGYRPVILVQIFLSLLSIYFIYLIGNSLLDYRLGLIAAILFSLDPLTISMNYKILTETLFLFLMIIFIYFGILWLKNPLSKSLPLITGIILGLLTLVRPITYYLPPFLIIGVIIWYYGNNFPVRKWINQVLLFIVPVVFLLGGWQYRNFIYGNNSSLSQIGGINMLYFRGASIIAEKENLTLNEARKRLIDNQIKNPWTYAGMHPEKNLNKKWENAGINIMIKHPLLSSKMIFRGMFNTLFGPADGYLCNTLGIGVEGKGPLWSLFNSDLRTFMNNWFIQNTLYLFIFIFACAFLFVIYLGIFAWICNLFLINRIDWYDFFLWGVLFYFLFISAGPESYFRFRQPIMPILIIYAVSGWISILDHFNYDRE